MVGSLVVPREQTQGRAHCLVVGLESVHEILAISLAGVVPLVDPENFAVK